MIQLGRVLGGVGWVGWWVTYQLPISSSLGLDQLTFTTHLWIRAIILSFSAQEQGHLKTIGCKALLTLCEIQNWPSIHESVLDCNNFG